MQYKIYISEFNMDSRNANCQSLAGGGVGGNPRHGLTTRNHLSERQK